MHPMRKKLNDYMIEGFSVTAQLFVPYIDTFMTFVNDTNLMHKLEVKEKAPVDTNHPLYKKKIVMTGFRDKLLEKAIGSGWHN